MTAKTEKRKFHELYAQVVDQIPADFMDRVAAAGHKVNFSRLYNVKYGKIADLDLLRLLIEVCLPDFNIPTEYKTAA